LKIEEYKALINCSHHRHIRPRRRWLLNYAPESTSPYPVPTCSQSSLQ